MTLMLQVLDALDDDPGHEGDQEQEHSRHDRARERVAELEMAGRDEPVEEQHDACRHEQRDPAAEALLEQAIVDPEPVERSLEPAEDHRLGQVEEARRRARGPPLRR